jgi:cobalt-zinc-cadmium resistance protein CzcA
MYMFTIEGEGLTLAERRTLLDWTIRPGPAQPCRAWRTSTALGGHGAQPSRWCRTVPPAAARRRDAGPCSMRALRGEQPQRRLGRIREGEETLLVRAEGSHPHPRRPARGGGGRQGSRPRRCGSAISPKCASASLTRYGAVTQATGAPRRCRAWCSGLRGANAREVVASVRARLAEIAPTLPHGRAHPRPSTTAARWSTAPSRTVSARLLEAVALVLVLLRAVPRRRAGAVAGGGAHPAPGRAVAPSSLMRRTELSANLMSLGGLAIAIGMLVDGAVVVVENIVTHLAKQRRPAPVRARAHRPRHARGGASRWPPGCCIIVIVFLPLLSLEGLEGKLFAPVALTIVYALGTSLCCFSLTTVPVLASLLLKPGRRAEPWLVRKAQGAYAPVLALALRHWRGLRGRGPGRAGGGAGGLSVHGQDLHAGPR